MEFSEIEIKNFRNFENIKINLKNKNIFFGLNDVGKTNFLYAFRYILDKNIRKLNLQDSDFYQKNLEVPIEITLKINIANLFLMKITVFQLQTVNILVMILLQDL